MSEKRISTGISKLDKHIEGGFEKRSVNLIEGMAGSGKTIFAVQYLIKQKEPGVFVTFEETKEKLIKHMLKLGWDLKKLEKQDKLIVLESSPEEIREFLESGSGLLENTIERVGAKHLVIDSITAFALLSTDELNERESCLALFKLINDLDCTALLVSEYDPDEKYGEDKALEFEVDGIIRLHFKEKNKKRERYLEILKMRGTKHTTNMFPIKIARGGITFSS